MKTRVYGDVGFSFKVFDLILRVLEPMLHTTVGRVLVVLGLTALVVLVASLLLRRRLREWRAEAALGRHLRATAKHFLAKEDYDELVAFLDR